MNQDKQQKTCYQNIGGKTSEVEKKNSITWNSKTKTLAAPKNQNWILKRKIEGPPCEIKAEQHELEKEELPKIAMDKNWKG